jgi:hypothetical protein
MRGRASFHIVAADFNPLLMNMTNPTRQLRAFFRHNSILARNAQPVSEVAFFEARMPLSANAKNNIISKVIFL